MLAIMRVAMVGKQSVDFVVHFVTDSVNLRTKLLSRGCRILIERRRNLIVVLLKQRPNLLCRFEVNSRSFVS